MHNLLGDTSDPTRSLQRKPITIVARFGKDVLCKQSATKGSHLEKMKQSDLIGILHHNGIAVTSPGTATPVRGSEPRIPGLSAENHKEGPTSQMNPPMYMPYAQPGFPPPGTDMSRFQQQFQGYRAMPGAQHPGNPVPVYPDDRQASQRRPPIQPMPIQQPAPPRTATRNSART